MSSRTTSGGQLVVTDRRIVFRPNRLDTIIGREPWECSVDAVASITTVDRERAVLGGRMRERRGIETADGVEIFVVNKLKKKAAELRELLGVP